MKTTCPLWASKKSTLCYLLLSISCLLGASVPIFHNQVGNSQLEPVGIKAITQSRLGYMWIGTISGIYKFDGNLYIKQFTDSKLNFANITDILIAHDKSIWIGTRKNGLYHYINSGGLYRVTSKEQEVPHIKKITQDLDDTIWVSTNSGVLIVDESNTFKQPKITSFNKIQKNIIGIIEVINGNQLLVATVGGFFIADLQTEKLEYVALKNNDGHIHDFLLDTHDNLWVATSNKLYKYNIKTRQFMPAPNLKSATRVLSIVQHRNTIWVATIDGGIFKINISTNQTTQYVHDMNFKYSLLENNIMNLFVSKEELLWIGGFSKGVDLLNLNTLQFGFETRTKDSVNCLKSMNISSINSHSSGDVFIGNEYGLTIYNPKTKSCNNIYLFENSIKINYTVYSTKIDNDFIWVSSSKGLLKYNRKKNIVENLFRDKNFSTVFFSLAINKDQLLVGTDRGLFNYSINYNTFIKIETPDNIYDNKPFIKYSINSKNEIFLPTSSGALYLNKDGEIKEFKIKNNHFDNTNIIDIQFNLKDEMLISVANNGLFYFDSTSKLIRHYLDNKVFSNLNSIYQIQFEKTGTIAWLASKEGLIKLNLQTHKEYLYSGFKEFNHLSATRASINKNGVLYFAGKNGYVTFNPENIKYHYQKPEIYLSDLLIMNRVIDKNKLYDVTKSHNSLEQIDNFNFSYKDKMLDFRFVDLSQNYLSNLNYYYKLEPLFPDWIKLKQSRKDLVFSSLNTGKYKLFIKASLNNTHLIVKTYNITVNPPPWFTWWAYLCYLLFSIISLKLYVKFKIQSKAKLNQLLSDEVKKKTMYIQKQNKQLKELIDSKNEIFANVTHEFRTPITLIKGPIAELLKQEKNKTNLSMLNLVERNSNRLLRLVNQMLELSLVNKTTSSNKKIVVLASALKLIADSYTYLAKDKNIVFEVKEMKNVELLLTDDALELMIGNLLSNAFKYSQNHGKIILGSVVTNARVEIYVQDNGNGFCMNQKDLIFKKFGRLTQHQKLEGAGIGLSIVKETAHLNNAEVYVTSTVGQGSRFSVSFPIQKVQIEKNNYSLISSQVHTNDKATILIIEDNDDMRFYIQKVLSKNFNCLMAPTGKQGVALAIKLVPDIIISDIMMPGIDGYHVCRLLREETITSHIPIILLTALIEKANRIKGWRENIDMYLCKPFDADELNMQLMNVLKIRNMLKQNNREKVNENKYLDLPEKDRLFLEKLNNHIEKLYFEPSFNLIKMSELMFITERQLQRKIKAMINLTPMELLREYRLQKASESLKNGYQISITSDTCGFGSLSYFSQVFKKHFGLTPKQYQNRHTKNT